MSDLGSREHFWNFTIRGMMYNVSSNLQSFCPKGNKIHLVYEWLSGPSNRIQQASYMLLLMNVFPSAETFLLSWNGVYCLSVCMYVCWSIYLFNYYLLFSSDCLIACILLNIPLEDFSVIWDINMMYRWIAAPGAYILGQTFIS